jgi:hypothetical protein
MWRVPGEAASNDASLQLSLTASHSKLRSRYERSPSKDDDIGDRPLHDEWVPAPLSTEEPEGGGKGSFGSSKFQNRSEGAIEPDVDCGVGRIRVQPM